MLAASLLAFAFAPGRVAPAVVRTDADLDFVANKTGFFLDASLAALRGEGGTHASHAQPKGHAPWDGADPRHPFLHEERTPDTLGPLFDKRAGTPPNLVFIIVEGLGRSFSGPGARLGSFTPFLDELAGRSLYFENFLAGQAAPSACSPRCSARSPSANTAWRPWASACRATIPCCPS